MGGLASHPPCAKSAVLALTDAIAHRRCHPPPPLQVRQLSRLYESAPAYVTDQPPFLNAAALVQSSLPPLELLRQLKEVEVGGWHGSEVSRWHAKPAVPDWRVISVCNMLYTWA